MQEPRVQIKARLPESRRRRFRILALQRGLTEAEALLQALEAWIATARPGELPREAPQPRASQERPAARGPRRVKPPNQPEPRDLRSAPRRPKHGRSGAPQVPEKAAAHAQQPSAQVLAAGRKRHAPAELNRPVVPAASRRRASASQRAPSLSKATAKDPLVPLAEDIAAASGMDTASALDLLRRAEKLGATLEAEDAAGMPVDLQTLSARGNQSAHDDANWGERALELDWSQCPAVESIESKRGPVWVFRGTRRPLWELFHNLQHGHSVDALMKYFPDMNEEQVVAVIQFAGERMYIPDL